MVLSLIGVGVGPAAAGGAGGAGSPELDAPPTVVVYVLREDADGAVETLFQISERFLGDGERFREVFELNRGRVQADGGVLEDPDVVRPGWVLQMPPDARGDGLELAEPATTTRGTPSQEDGDRTAVVITVAVAGASVLAAVLVWWLRRRRGRRPAPAPPRGRVDDSAAWTVDRATRALAAECHRRDIALPAPYVVTVDARTITLNLTAPRGTAPAPWVVRDDGRQWQAALRDVQSVPLGDDPAPYPWLVTLGTDDAGLVLLDLSRARGVISVTGEPALRRALLELWIKQLQNSPWSRSDLPIVRVGFDDGGLAGTQTVDALADAALEVQAQHDGLLFMAAAPGRRERTALQEMLGTPDASWTYVVAGEVPYARWRFSIAADGALDTDFLDAPVLTGVGAR